MSSTKRLNRSKLGGRIMGIIFLISQLWLPLLALDKKSIEIREYSIKAYLLFRIISEINWPKEAGIEDRNKPFILTVIDNPFGRSLIEQSSDWYYKGKKIYIQQISEPEDISPDCNVLYIAEVGRKKFEDILAYVSGRPILTIGDVAGYAEKGILMDLVMDYESETSKTSIQVNEVAARKAGFTLPDRYLKKSASINNINPYNEYEDKAVQLGRFAQFINWPDSTAIKERNKPFVIAILGDKDFAKTLIQVYRKEKIKNKPVNIRVIESANDIGEPHILFIPQTKKNEIISIISFIKKKSILTVSDSEDFLNFGVMIVFVFDGPRLLFDIHNTAAKEAGLDINFRLLESARHVFPPKK